MKKHKSKHILHLCDKCNYTHNKASRLKYHKLRCHPEDRDPNVVKKKKILFKCDKCEYQSIKQYNVKVHESKYCPKLKKKEEFYTVMFL